MLRYKNINSIKKNKQRKVTINERGEVRGETISTVGVPCASPIDFNSKAKRALINNLNSRHDKYKR